MTRAYKIKKKAGLKKPTSVSDVFTDIRVRIFDSNAAKNLASLELKKILP